MASKRRNMFHKNKTQETTEEGRLMTDNAQLTNKNAQSTQDIVTKQAEIYECKKVITELEIKVRQTTNTFEAVRAERNNLSHQLTETKPRLSPPQRVREIFLTAYPESAVFADDVPQTPYCLESPGFHRPWPARSLPLQLCPEPISRLSRELRPV
ncbi:hypothetical protein AAG570_009424 [Ranatra chinensis]|uniref:Cilia- and flagella-associated protein 58 central coiled coil domain-containing protein n=1 Tax=Ranatra chinensis TaxID=642074 RepID=A0ABD0Z657_9HEMI